MEQQLIAYVALAILSWVPSLPLESTEHWHARAHTIASDIAQATLATKLDRRASPDDESGKYSATLLAAIATLETGKSFAPWIEDGSCNDEAWRHTHADLLKRNDADCDGGHAFSFWQIHPVRDNREEGWTLAHNRVHAASIALLWAGSSLQKGIRLCGYTGERYPNCPKGDARLNLAVRFLEDHPFEIQ